MDNQINLQELREQAKAFATESTLHFTGDEPVFWMDFYTEKFAALVAAAEREAIINILSRTEFTSPSEAALIIRLLRGKRVRGGDD